MHQAGKIHNLFKSVTFLTLNSVAFLTLNSVTFLTLNSVTFLTLNSVAFLTLNSVAFRASLAAMRTSARAVARALIGGGGVYIHISRFCPTNFF